METLDEFYEAYGDTLLKRLPALGKLVFIDDNEGMSDVIRATKAGMNAERPILIWQQFDERLRTAKRDNYHQEIDGSLAVLFKVPKEPLSQRQAKRQAKALCLQLLALMLEDGIDGLLAATGIRVELDGASGESISQVGDGWSGYGYGFGWLVPLDLSIGSAGRLVS